MSELTGNMEAKMSRGPGVGVEGVGGGGGRIVIDSKVVSSNVDPNEDNNGPDVGPTLIAVCGITNVALPQL